MGYLVIVAAMNTKYHSSLIGFFTGNKQYCYVIKSSRTILAIPEAMANNLHILCNILPCSYATTVIFAYYTEMDHFILSYNN